MGGAKMKRDFIIVCIAIAALLSGGSHGLCEDGTHYARCNLKVINGNYITWVNWQSTPDYIPVGSQLSVIRNGSKATLVVAKTGKTYTLDIGADGDAYLEKFVTKIRPNLSKLAPAVKSHVQRTIAKHGMTKEEVYMAMGPPARIGDIKTDTMTYEDIMQGNLWIYARRRFGKNIGVEFHPVKGIVIRTEGFWE
jgi:hypothetical protein